MKFENNWGYRGLDEIKQIVDHPYVAAAPPLVVFKSDYDPIVGLLVVGDIIGRLHSPLFHH